MKNAIIKQYNLMFKIDGINIEFSENAVKAIAKRAMELKTGARGLRTILENNLLDAMYDLPSSNIKKFELDAKNKKLLLKYEENNSISSSSAN